MSLAKPTWEEQDRKRFRAATGQSTQNPVCRVRIDGEDGICDPRPVSAPTHTPASTSAVNVPAPVSVTNVDGVEQISYYSAKMVENKIYPVEWNGRKYALRKSGDKVELLELDPADDG